MKLFITGFVILILLFLWVISPPDQAPKLVVDKTSITAHKIEFLNTALELLKKDTGYTPDSFMGFSVLYYNLNNDERWDGPYITKIVVTTDSWGRELIYKFSDDCGDNTGVYVLYSVGENGIDECLGGDDIH